MAGSNNMNIKFNIIYIHKSSNKYETSHISFVMSTIGQTQTDKLMTWQKDETAQRTDNQQNIRQNTEKYD